MVGMINEADTMSPHDLQNWVALYVATFFCSIVALAASVVSIGIELLRERVWSTVRTPRDVIVFVPKIWWRWQQRYLMGSPVTIGIVAWFALSLRW